MRIPPLPVTPAAGVHLVDDFIRTASVSSRWGDLLWELTDLVSASTLGTLTPASALEAGILQITTAASVGAGGILGHTGATPFYRAPPPGSVWAAKIRTSSSSGYEIWSGFAASAVDVSGTSNSFVGVRATGGDLYGVVRSGTAESTVDLGLDCEGTWRTVGFERLADGTYQFFTADGSDGQWWDRTDVGSPVAATNTPTVALSPIALGFLSSDGSARSGQVDWWALGGRTPR